MYDIGDSGLLFGLCEMCFYLNGKLVVYILGGVGFGCEGVSVVEVIGVVGVEKIFDDILCDLVNGGKVLMFLFDLII